MKVFYLRNKKGKPVACVASEKSQAIGIAGGSQVHFHLSVCNSTDTFSKEIGRAIAIGRLYGFGGSHAVPNQGHIKRSIMEMIAHGTAKNFPGRARKAAHAWLANAKENQE